MFNERSTSHEFRKIVQVVIEVVGRGLGDKPGNPLDKLLVEAETVVVVSFPRFDDTFDAGAEPPEDVTGPGLLQKVEAFVLQDDGKDQASSQQTS